MAIGQCAVDCVIVPSTFVCESCLPCQQLLICASVLDPVPLGKPPCPIQIARCNPHHATVLGRANQRRHLVGDQPCSHHDPAQFGHVALFPARGGCTSAGKVCPRIEFCRLRVRGGRPTRVGRREERRRRRTADERALEHTESLRASRPRPMSWFAPGRKLGFSAWSVWVAAARPYSRTFQRRIGFPGRLTPGRGFHHTLQ